MATVVSFRGRTRATHRQLGPAVTVWFQGGTASQFTDSYSVAPGLNRPSYRQLEYGSYEPTQPRWRPALPSLPRHRASKPKPKHTSVCGGSGIYVWIRGAGGGGGGDVEANTGGWSYWPFSALRYHHLLVRRFLEWAPREWGDRVCHLKRHVHVGDMAFAEEPLFPSE